MGNHEWNEGHEWGGDLSGVGKRELEIGNCGDGVDVYLFWHADIRL